MIPSPGDVTSIRGATSIKKKTAQALSTQYIVVRAPKRSETHPPSARITPDGKLNTDAINPAIARLIP